MTINYCVFCLHFVFLAKKFKKRYVNECDRLLSYEKYTEEKYRLWVLSCKRNQSPFAGLYKEAFKHVKYSRFLYLLKTVKAWTFWPQYQYFNLPNQFEIFYWSHLLNSHRHLLKFSFNLSFCIPNNLSHSILV